MALLLETTGTPTCYVYHELTWDTSSVGWDSLVHMAGQFGPWGWTVRYFGGPKSFGHFGPIWTLGVFGVGSPRRARSGASGCAERVSSPRRRSKLASCSDVNKTTRFKTKAKAKTEGHKTKTTSVKTQDQDQDHRTNYNNVLAPDRQRNYFLQHSIL